MGSALDDLKSMPDEVRQYFGYSLYKAQLGEYPPTAKALSGFDGASVIELKENWHGDTFRAIYTVHCFKKKSNSGIATPKPDIDLIKSRLKRLKQQIGEFK